MSRTYQICFDLINEGAYTPETARQEANDMFKLAPELYADAIELLVTWAMNKDDEAWRMQVEAGKTEVRTAETMVSHARARALGVRLAAMRAASDAALAAGEEEPF